MMVVVETQDFASLQITIKNHIEFETKKGMPIVHSFLLY
jgi:hypothetical protein